MHFVGASFDRTGGYGSAMTTFAIAVGCVLLLLSTQWFGKRPARPADATA